MNQEITLPENLHPDTKQLVIDFSIALANKLYESEQKYGYTNSWKSLDWIKECKEELIRHIEKGDPRDVAAYAAFLWYHNESTKTEESTVNISRSKNHLGRITIRSNYEFKFSSNG